MGYTLLDGDDPSIEVFMGVFRKVRVALGVTAFGINEIRLPPNAQGRGHDEAELSEEEVYVGLAGSGTFTVDDEVLAFGPGTYLRVDPSSTRVVQAGPDGLTFIAIGAPVGSRRGRPTL
jgi:mannose-6-phosphate isomerase-like protein (cupin superfamily)